MCVVVFLMLVSFLSWIRLLSLSRFYSLSLCRFLFRNIEELLGQFSNAVCVFFLCGVVSGCLSDEGLSVWIGCCAFCFVMCCVVVFLWWVVSVLGNSCSVYV